MNQTTNVQGFATEKEAREYLKSQLAQYLEQQPESIQAFHRWMKRLEVASVGIIRLVTQEVSPDLRELG